MLTDGQTDGQTDGRTDGRTEWGIAIALSQIGWLGAKNSYSLAKQIYCRCISWRCLAGILEILESEERSRTRSANKTKYILLICHNSQELVVYQYHVIIIQSTIKLQMQTYQ